MSQRASAIVWLIAGLAFGLVTLSCAGAGGYALWYTHDKATAAEKIYEEEKNELEQGKFMPPARFKELNARRSKNSDDVNDWRQYRQYALVFMLTAIIPLLITGRCLFSGVMGMLKKPKNEDEEEDRPRKQKTPDDDDDRPVKKPAKKKVADDDHE